MPLTSYILPFYRASVGKEPTSSDLSNLYDYSMSTAARNENSSGNSSSSAVRTNKGAGSKAAMTKEKQQQQQQAESAPRTAPHLALEVRRREG